MSKLWLIGLAASAAWTPAAIAQGAAAPMAHGVHAPAAPMMHPGVHHPLPMPGAHKGFHRFSRGHIIPPHFRGGHFIVHDWRMFGFPAPMPGGHWIRHHDDALLIDRDGRVMDSRYDWDWDRRRERVAHDDEDYDDDYDRDDEWDDDGDSRRHHRKRDRMVRVYRYGGLGKADCRRRCAPVHHIPPRHPGYGYGWGYGYGCGCGPVVVTETITTTEPVVETRTYYETVTERAAPRRHYAKPVRRYVKPVKRAPPAPRPGERG